MKKILNILILLLFSFLITAITGNWSKIYASPSFVTEEEEDSYDTREEEMEEEENSNEDYESDLPDEEEGSEEKSEETEDYSWY